MTATWGLSATIKAPPAEILHWAAYHLEAGAHRLHIYLDDDNRAAFDRLRSHPKVRVTLCDADYWEIPGGGSGCFRNPCRNTR